MTTEQKRREEILAENEALRRRLEEAEDTLRAIGNGEVDAFVVSGPEGRQIFTLKGAEQPYRILVETMSEGAATLAADGSILYCNNRLAEILGTPLQNLLGSPIDGYVAPADLPLFSALMETCTKEHATAEMTMLTDAGHAVPVFFSCCLHDAGGSPVLSVVVTDLTQQKRNEEIVASERLASSIIEQAGEVIVVCDAQGKVMRASHRSRLLCGENPLLMPFDQQFPLRVKDTSTLFSVAHPLAGEHCENLEVVFKRGGHQVSILLLNAAPLEDDRNRIIGCVVSLNDITERHRAEEALISLNKDLESRVAARTKDLAVSVETLKAEIAEREIAEARRKEIEGALHDQTSRRLLAVEALREKEQMLILQSRQAAMGEMISNIAHQWRQPLNTLALSIQELKMTHDFGECTDAFMEQSVGKSMDLIQHMSQTIDDFRNYFKPEKDKTEFKVAEVIASTLLLIEDSFKHQKVAVELVTRHAAVVFGYRNEFMQTLLNILNNARDALSEREIEHPRVTVSLSRKGGRAVVTVTDNAGGIPEEIIDKVFDPYFTTKGPQTGTGLGLFMSKTIVEKNLGGSLTVRNVPGGAEFKIEV